MEDRTCRECNEVFNDPEQVRRHLRKHGMTFQQYSLRHFYGGVEPTCRCGCGQKTAWNVASKGYAEHILGHHAWGRKKSDDEKRRIGEKNAANMKRFYEEYPELAEAQASLMRQHLTPEIEEQRIEATRQAYAAMSSADKQSFRDRTRQRWIAGEMNEPHAKAAETFKQKSTNGDYDFSERNEKLSKVISQKYVDGTWEFTKGTYVSTKSGRECYYRSSWELLLMQELDIDPDVADWESEFTSIPYVFDGSQHRYVPDFKVVRSAITQIVEVKPKNLRNIERNIAKRQAALAYCERLGWQYVEWEPATN